MRISSLPSLGACPGWWLLSAREPRRVGPAADTGSAAGRAIALYHGGHPPREACALAFADAYVAEHYPRVDLRRARRLAEAYAADPANPPSAATDCEREVFAEVGDTAGAPLEIRGHVDHVRAGRVWDLKAGMHYGGEAMLGVHALQLAGYAVAGGWEPGGIIRLAAYESGGPVFWPAPWDRVAARALLETVRADVGDLRAGVVKIRPGAHCAWCPAGNPGACLARFRAEPPRAEEAV